jgi:hypothetical protein
MLLNLTGSVFIYVIIAGQIFVYVVVLIMQSASRYLRHIAAPQWFEV